MVVFGVLLLVLAGLGTAGVVWSGRDVQVHLEGFGVSVTTSVLWVFVAGAVAMLLVLWALSAFRRANRRWREQRHDAKSARAEAALRESAPPTDYPAQHSVDVRDEATQPVPAHDPGAERRYVPEEDAG